MFGDKNNEFGPEQQPEGGVEFGSTGPIDWAFGSVLGRMIYKLAKGGVVTPEWLTSTLLEVEHKLAKIIEEKSSTTMDAQHGVMGGPLGPVPPEIMKLMTPMAARMMASSAINTISQFFSTLLEALCRMSLAEPHSCGKCGGAETWLEEAKEMEAGGKPPWKDCCGAIATPPGVLCFTRFAEVTKAWKRNADPDPAIYHAINEAVARGEDAVTVIEQYRQGIRPWPGEEAARDRSPAAEAIELLRETRRGEGPGIWSLEDLLKELGPAGEQRGGDSPDPREMN